MLIAAALALVLIAGLGVGGWLFGTGRLGFGPLSAADKAAAAAIAEGVEGPEWADDDQRRCAADALMGERRSSALADSGVIEGDGDDWTYTGTWETSDAQAFAEHLLECDDWEEQVGEAWSLPETDCLADIGSSALADFVAVDTLGLESDDAVDDADQTVAELDECYAMEVSAPSAQPEPAYRAVRFVFDSEAMAEGTATTISYAGRDVALDREVFRARADEGGQEVCITTRVSADYAWGTSRTAETESCGESAPKKVYWKELPSCSDTSAGPCRSWALRFEGFASDDIVTGTLSENGGDCGSVSGQCTFSTPAPATGRGVVVTWSAPPTWNERFTGTIDGQVAVLPN